MGFVVLLAKAMGTMDSEERQQLPLLRWPSGGNERVSGLSSVEVERILEHKPVPLRRYVRLVGWESRSLWLLSWASIIVSVCNYMLSFVTLTFSGQLGALELAGASIAMVGAQGLAYGIMKMHCLEIWYNQGLVLISGLLPNPTISLDSLSICLNYWTWDIEFMLGLSAAVSIRIGNELGAGNPMVARFSMVVVVMISILISIFFSAIVLIFKVGLSKLFTSDAEVIAAVSNLTPLLAISVFLNGIQPILSGVAIGSGWQAVVAYVNLTTYYVVGLPIGCVLGFKTDLGAAGLWWGMVIGVLLQTATLIFITARTNWNSEVAKAADRLKKSGNEEALEQSEGAC
ncbi:hypothetical protein RHSIM_Rhsim01G0201200 [Rhododendron simsii]|uniref:Uncharacterized protein n=1 Tax=Rhododendron simsii TaxID=118357 RepID=A0A834LUH7_RHOSS|nr:hypothetical protein RHSIM_Rhsim01G0201200 [Rhododendron simsii]